VEHDRLTLAPILVEDLGAVLGLEGAAGHDLGSFVCLMPRKATVRPFAKAAASALK
jgi:hypothetical protein